MRNVVKLLSVFMVLSFGLSKMNAQRGSTYNTGIGILADVGDGTMAGPHVKHFFSRNRAGEFAVLFGGGATHLSFMYHYEQPFGGGAKGLAWYIGMGPGFSFPKGGGNTVFSIAPVAGIDFKIPSAPLGIFFDWRPRVWFYSGDSDFNAARFGLGMRFTF